MMGELATERAAQERETAPLEGILRDELVRGDRALKGVPPVLTHLIANSGYSLVSEAIVARVRGMLADVARQLFDALELAHEGEAIDELATLLAGESVVLSHFYAIAMEGHLTERFEETGAIDPVLSTLIQELIAADEPTVSELAMKVLAAQSRFMQTQKRMAMPLAELPSEVQHAVLKRAGGFAQSSTKDHSISALRESFDEGTNRTGLLARLVHAIQGGARAALELEHAGFALFSSAVSTLTHQPRELAILACHEQQGARFALTMRAAGLDAAAIERQFLLIEPSQELPIGLDGISPKRAAAMLGHSDIAAVG